MEEIKQRNKDTEEQLSVRRKTNYEDFSQKYITQNNLCTKMQENFFNDKPDLIVQLKILYKIIIQDDRVDWHSLIMVSSFAFLFMAIDMLAIVLKMTSTGIYEVKADMMEYANAIHSFCQNRHETILHFSKLSEREQEYLDDLQEGGSKEGLRTNLNTMIDAFNKADAKKLAEFFKRYLSEK
jgi:hypothetical protein